jgi:hypothetical protein
MPPNGQRRSCELRRPRADGLLGGLGRRTPTSVMASRAGLEAVQIIGNHDPARK